MDCRTAAGSEVDVILERPDGSFAAIEVKASHPVTMADFKALRTLRDQRGALFRAGIVYAVSCGEAARPPARVVGEARRKVRNASL